MAGCARVAAENQSSRVVTGGSPPPRLLAAVAAGGALGALARWALTEAFPADAGRVPVVDLRDQRRRLLRAGAAARPSPSYAAAGRSRSALGPGVLGGFTTLSAYSEQSRALLAAGHTAVAAASTCVGTLAACLVAVPLARPLVDRAPAPALRPRGR